MARCHHQLPLHFVGLDLCRALKELHGLLVHFILHEVRPQPRDDVHVHGEVPVRLQMVVEGLGLVVFFGVNRTQPCQHIRVGGDTRHQPLEPLTGLVVVTHQVVQVGDVVRHLRGVRDHGLQLLEHMQRAVVRLLVLAELLGGEPQIVHGLDAVRLHGQRVHVQLLRLVVLLLHVVEVAPVHEGLGVVLVGRDGHVRVLLPVLDVPLQEVQVRQVGGGLGLQLLVLLLEGLQGVDGLVVLLVLQELQGLAHLHLRGQP
mmetsp:Transcript_59818/g.98643  ORF Transcript_59818/g.98643 Transcript_59818/m.98643 type:complete len:258 (-) Transcript_59818:1314-2087(-)